MILANFCANWADEFCVEGFQIFTEDDWAAFSKVLDSDESFEMYYGTNEGWYEDASWWKSHIKAVEISEEEYNVLKNVFGGNGFGWFPDFLEYSSEFVDTEEIYEE